MTVVPLESNGYTWVVPEQQAVPELEEPCFPFRKLYNSWLSSKEDVVGELSWSQVHMASPFVGLAADNWLHRLVLDTGYTHLYNANSNSLTYCKWGHKLLPLTFLKTFGSSVTISGSDHQGNLWKVKKLNSLN